MRSQNLVAVTISMVALLVSCASFTTRPEAPDDLGWLYDSVIFEVAPITSAQPSPRALEIFRNRLHDNHICQRENIQFVVRDVAPGLMPGLPWNSGVIQGYEHLRRSLHDRSPNDRHLRVFVAYIDGIWMDHTGFRFLGGIQYAPTSFAIFKSGAADREAAVLLHEFGHIIGLVKDETAENHDDEHPHHCSVKRCVMYYSAPGNDSDFGLYCRRSIFALIRAREAEREFDSRPAVH